MYSIYDVVLIWSALAYLNIICYWLYDNFIKSTYFCERSNELFMNWHQPIDNIHSLFLPILVECKWNSSLLRFSWLKLNSILGNQSIFYWMIVILQINCWMILRPMAMGGRVGVSFSDYCNLHWNVKLWYWKLRSWKLTKGRFCSGLLFWKPRFWDMSWKERPGHIQTFWGWFWIHACNVAHVRPRSKNGAKNLDLKQMRL